MTEKTKTVFRTWKDGQVIALFPEIPWTRDGHACATYEHTGQHGSAGFGHVVAATTKATPNEYAPLLRELTAIGYNVEIRARETRKMREIRYNAAKGED